MDKFFGGKNPFDHPFFTQPFGGLFGGKSPFDDPFFTGKSDGHSGSRKQITIEELNPDDDGGHDVWQKNAPSKEVSVKEPDEYPSGFQGFSYQSVAFGGPNGSYYTSSVGRRTGGDGVFLMEMKEDDKTIGESLHTISKGIHDKGHSVTTKQSSDGGIDSLQTLHNLQEDELAGFEENWKTNAEKVLPGWSDGFNLLENAGANYSFWDDFANWNGWSGWPFPSLEYYGNGGAQPDGEAQGSNSRGASRKIVPVE
jgi:myeloid leukemia factor 1